MSKKKIYFRADAGSNIGYGHFIRTLALADILKNDFDCTFFTTSPTPYQIGEMEKTCKHVALEEKSKFMTFLEYLKGDEIVVLDNYFYTTDYQRRIKDKGCKLVCIDDIHDKHYVADLVINQAINAKEEDYSCETYTRFAFGLRYSLLRRPFFDACKMAIEKKQMSQGLRVVVAFGGSDFFDLTNKVIMAIKDIDVVNSITAIVGDSYGVENMVKDNNVFYLKNLSAHRIADLFLSSDVAILPCSTMMNEALACGITAIGGYYVQNQENDYYAFKLENMIMGVGDYSEPDAMYRLQKILGRVIQIDQHVISADTPQGLINLFKTI